MQTPFIKKIKKILQDPQNADVVCWNLDRTMIQIRNEKLFEQRVLAKHFRHNRISSFIRQLNLYGFKKIRSAEFRTFTHPFLQKGLGLQTIINKKKKIGKDSQQNIQIDSINIELGQQRQGEEIQRHIKKQIRPQHRISQNSNLNKQVEKEEQIAIATNNYISTPDQCLNTIWVFPVSNMTPNFWRMPYGKIGDGLLLNYNYNSFQNWC